MILSHDNTFQWEIFSCILHDIYLTAVVAIWLNTDNKYNNLLIFKFFLNTHVLECVALNQSYKANSKQGMT